MVFASSVALKTLSLSLFMQLRFFWRPKGRAVAFDLGLLYFGTYAFLGSNVPGVYYTWPMYRELVQKMIESPKMQRRGLRNTAELLEQTSDLPDFKASYYLADM